METSMGNSIDKQKHLDEGFQQCTEITRKYGTSFYFATQFFPKDVRQAVYAVYAFARIPDEIVDDPNLTDNKIAIEKLNVWRDKWLEATKLGYSNAPIMNAIV